MQHVLVYWLTLPFKPEHFSIVIVSFIIKIPFMRVGFQPSHTHGNAPLTSVELRARLLYYDLKVLSFISYESNLTNGSPVAAFTSPSIANGHR